MADGILKDKAYKFALRMIKLFRHLSAKNNEYVISRQVLRSGTSIGANLEEAYQAESRADFIHKLAIANKEAFETHYWLRLLGDSEILEQGLADSLIGDCSEIMAMLVSSIKSAKRAK